MTSFVGRVESAAEAALMKEMEPLLTPEQLVGFKWSLEHRTRDVVVLGNRDTLAPIVQQFRLEPAKNRAGLAALERYKARLRLDDANRFALLTELKGVLSAWGAQRLPGGPRAPASGGDRRQQAGRSRQRRGPPASGRVGAASPGRAHHRFRRRQGRSSPSVDFLILPAGPSQWVARQRYSHPPLRSFSGRIRMNASTAWIWPS